MSAGKRASLPNSAFAGRNRSFPVNDRAHAEAAIMDSGSAPDPSAVRAKARSALAHMGGGGMPSGKHESIVHSDHINMQDHKMPSKKHGGL